MRFEEVLRLTRENPIFETSLLLAGPKNPQYVRTQLSRWVRAGKLHLLRRGLYLIAEPYRATTPHPFKVANLLVQPSYVSLQAALAYYNLIPEHVPNITSVTVKRPGSYHTPLGWFSFRHIQRALFWGYVQVDVDGPAFVWVAKPEKALLDLLYLTPRSDQPTFLEELRLQHWEQLNIQRLWSWAQRMRSKKVERAVRHLRRMFRANTTERVEFGKAEG